MAEVNNQSISSESISTSDAEAIKHFEQAIAEGKHWYIALLEAMGLWSSAEEVHNDRTYRYLIDGEAFDWLLLAERLCETVNGLLPEDEKNALLFHGTPPLELSAKEVKVLIGSSKYGQYLNYFYGITVEGALLLAVQEEIDKERQLFGYRNKHESADEAYRRIYDTTRAALLKSFRQERGYPQTKSITLTELKEFTYWLFKYRLKQCEKAKIASDTKKALGYLKRQRSQKGLLGELANDGSWLISDNLLALVVPAGALTVSTGTLAPRSTLSVTLPKAKRLSPDLPCVDIAIMSAWISSAALRISSAALPALTLIFTVAPFPLKVSPALSR